MVSSLQQSTDVEYLLSQLTRAEKVALLSGVDGWQTADVSRLGIGSIKTTDGPVGARGNQIVDGPRALFLPAAVLLASTWCKSDVCDIGRVLCRESKTKASHVLLAPTICCHRNPLGGRNFESFSEDPLLSGILAIEYVKGVQETGEVSATAKHFVANEQEYRRFSINASIDEKTLREIYLRPFEMLVKSPHPPGCFMTAYNCVNGEHMDSNKSLIGTVLRETWGYKGVVMSDWGGTNSTIESVLAGCDLEMPGPPQLRGEKLLKALDDDKATDLKSAVDSSCRRLLNLAKQLNLLGLSMNEAKATRTRQEYSSDCKEDITLVRRVAASGAVLLKNSHKVLPLDPKRLHNKRVAFIGPYSKTGSPGGGGSASMNPQYLSHPMDAFEKLASQLGISVSVATAPGVYSKKWLPLTSKKQWKLPIEPRTESVDEDAMLRVDFYKSHDLSGSIHETSFRTSSYVDLFDTAPEELIGKPYSFRITSTVTPLTSGQHLFGISSVGNAKLYVDGLIVIDNDNWTRVGETFYAFGSMEAVRSMKMEAGRSYAVMVECSTKTPTGDQFECDGADLDPMHVFAYQAGVRLGFVEELPSALRQDAIELSNKSDYTVLVLGLDDEWESEGYDRENMALPSPQDSFVTALLEQSRNPESIIIVNQSGTPVEMPWASDQRVATILQIWYGGQEAGNALADVLMGVTPPSGHLPMTWPKKYTDLHFAHNRKAWPGSDGTVNYEEGSNVGYRWYLKNQVEPQWWFGYGLGYTEFQTTKLSIKQGCSGESRWEVSVLVRNTGNYADRGLIQVYFCPSEDPGSRILAAFERTQTLAPGQTEDVTIFVKPRDVAHWDKGRWVLDAGAYDVCIGQSAGDFNPASTLHINVSENLTWQP